MADQLEEIGVSFPKDIIVHYTFRNLPKEYDTFKDMQTNKDNCLAYEAFEDKLLSKEIVLRLVGEDCGKVLVVEGHNNIFGNSNNYWFQIGQNPNGFFRTLNNNDHHLMA